MTGRPTVLPTVLLLAVSGGFCPPLAGAAEPPTGLQDKVQIASPTRLDWKFVAGAFGADAAKLPAGYESGKQHYQLFVPRDYDAKKAWPLVVFISPGDEPLGWRYWQKVCEKSGALFCAAYGAGNSCPVGQRTRIVLDMLDDVRRHYRVDPDQTYLTGFSGGGRMACTIAFALPEYFGGVAPVCGTNPLPSLDYLRHRVHDRLSVAFITGETDFNRKENEAYMAPLFEDVGIRSKLWVVPKLGHGVPSADVLAEVYDWLADDVRRRRDDAKDRPGLAALPGEVPTAEKQAARQIEEAQKDLKSAGRVWRGAALLRGVVQRWPNSDAGDKAQKLLEEALKDEATARAIGDEGGKDERRLLTAQAKALDRLGDTSGALKAWRLLAKSHADTPEGKKAAEEAKRLAEVLAATPYLGVSFAPNSLLIADVVRGGPADKAGLKKGDKVLKVGDTEVTTPEQLREQMAKHKVRPGDGLFLEVRRGGKDERIGIKVGSPPVDEQ